MTEILHTGLQIIKEYLSLTVTTGRDTPNTQNPPMPATTDNKRQKHRSRDLKNQKLRNQYIEVV